MTPPLAPPSSSPHPPPSSLSRTRKLMVVDRVALTEKAHTITNLHVYIKLSSWLIPVCVCVCVFVCVCVRARAYVARTPRLSGMMCSQFVCVCEHTIHNRQGAQDPIHTHRTDKVPR